MKWISHVSSEHGFGVRVPTRPPLIGCPKINLFVRNTNIQVKSFYKKNQYTFQESEIYGKRLILDN